ncbi:MAG: hypothetical protein MRY32_04225 [Rickettsiales bacterium]|nr:hypothetical protein [Rickettsiales bacterium]
MSNHAFKGGPESETVSSPSASDTIQIYDATTKQPQQSTFDALFQADAGNKYVTLDEATTVTASDNGKTFYLNDATEFAVTMPAASLFGGCRVDFICADAPESADYTIVTAGSENVLAGHISSADLDATIDGSSATAGDTITFADGVAALGDWVSISGDGTSLFVRGSSAATGGITITQESA